MSTWYRTGTVTVSNGSASVTGILTGWTDGLVKDGDAIFVPASSSYPGEILSVNGSTSITLNANWHGTSQTGVSYFIFKGMEWGDVTRLATEISKLIDNQVAIIGGTGTPSDADGYADGTRYFRDDAPEYYVKAAGTYGSPINLTGPAGPATAIFGTSTTSRTLGTGSMAFTTQAGVGWVVGSRLRFTSAANPTTHYMEGVVTAYSSTSLTATMDRFIGTGTRADWNIAFCGDVGATGTTGASYSATSTTSLAVGTGTKAFTTQSGLAYVAGQRVRAASAANTANYMEGRITSYSSTTLTVSVDLTGGSGTLADWNIGVAGQQGIQGVQGLQGDQGIQGIQGPGYAGTSTTSLSVGTGSKVFTTQAGLAYVVGASRARASDSSGANYVEGLVTAYSGTSLTISADRAVGSGTISSWNISLAGDVGAAGTNGATYPFRGAYSGATAYVANDVVTDQSSSWVCILAGTGNAPPTLPTTSNSYWTALAVKGSDGAGAVNSVNSQTGTVVLGASDIAVAATAVNISPAGNSINDWLAASDTAIGNGANYAETTIASASTVNIGGAVTTVVVVTGTTTITSLGTVATKLRIVRFSGALTLTYNATSLILPDAANKTTAAGDIAIFVSDGSGNWRCISYQQANTIPSKAATQQVFTSSGTWTKPAGCKRVKVTVIGGGGAGGGAVAATSNCSIGQGGGSGGISIKSIDVTAISSETVTIGAGGTGSSGASGANGGNTTFGAHCTGGGGTGGAVVASGTAQTIVNAQTPGMGSGGDVNGSGLIGATGVRFSGTIGGTAQGGSTPFGTPGGARLSAGAGVAGQGYGAGGSGALSFSASSFAGANGLPGIVIVEEYY